MDPLEWLVALHSLKPYWVIGESKWLNISKDCNLRGVPATEYHISLDYRHEIMQHANMCPCGFADILRRFKVVGVRTKCY